MLPSHMFSPQLPISGRWGFLGDMHRGPTWTTSLRMPVCTGSLTSLLYLQTIYQFLWSLLPSSPESCISHILISLSEASQVALVVKNWPASPGDVKDRGFISGLGRSPGGVHGYHLQYSCLENPMERRAWWATVHRISENWTWLSDLAYTHGEKKWPL